MNSNNAVNHFHRAWPVQIEAPERQFSGEEKSWYLLLSILPAEVIY